jgi:predicted N-formylglutamate amidohydrolase
MNSHLNQKLLSPSDPPPVHILNPRGASSFLLLGDHAGNAVPSDLATLGLSDVDINRHIALDIGVAGLGERLSASLDATFIQQHYSRLVVDCNRDPNAADAIPAFSDGTPILPNANLSSEERASRVAAIHAPYQSSIAAELLRRDSAGQVTTIVSLHSFTPSMQGIARPWHIGILYSGGNTRFARKVLRLLNECPQLVVGDNEPYLMDEVDHTIPRHAFGSSRPYVEIEIRQDLLMAPKGQDCWCAILTDVLKNSLD